MLEEAVKKASKSKDAKKAQRIKENFEKSLRHAEAEVQAGKELEGDMQRYLEFALKHYQQVLVKGRDEVGNRVEMHAIYRLCSLWFENEGVSGLMEGLLEEVASEKL
eukprot:TRINITY_DN10656_c0_g1_i1.p2 TRINITY_DN10656_c0_g1~~TRINITY_DN10656_c0_g1_i1.p2  ORF type:complete len:107 (-),score=39.24 TRINITY_DN10656_c0_g1_i1:1504-1824(-)